jgi:cytochrome c biogenesis protein CcdA/thiol-disulfide isomerase/thioredoxin
LVVLLVVAFVSGLLTILAPCIWPLLPIVLADVTQSDSKRRPLGITAGVALSFTVLTLTVSGLESSLGLDPNILRKVAVIVLLILGTSMVIPKASQWLEARISRISGKFGNLGKNQRKDFTGGFITGLALGIVWAPCSGPILASIATLASTNKVSIQVLLVTLFYVAGVSIPLFAFALGGQRLLVKSKKISRFTGKIQIASGLVLLITALAIYTNYDKTIEAKLLNSIPSYSNSLTKIESTKSVTDALNKLKGKSSFNSSPQINSNLFNQNYPARGFEGGTGWLNTSAPLVLESLKGKVVLVDFWTYTCINCIRTLPHVTSWYNKYHPYGLEVIGVHSPEFAFEQDKGNVASAIKRFNIQYPVVQDNRLNIWNSYNNEYWPAEYLIDSQGNVRRVDFGEGQYDQMEAAIRTLLGQIAVKLPTGQTVVPDETPISVMTPETYFGSNRDQYAFPNPIISAGSYKFGNASKPPLNQFSFGGNWDIAPEFAKSSPGSTIVENFTGSHVYIILKPRQSGATDKVLVSLNGLPLSGSTAGSDVRNGVISVTQDRLYDVFDSSKSGTGLLKFTFQNPGTEAFTFTFG